MWDKSQQVSMHMEHKAGEKMFIDFTGTKMEIVDKCTGEIKEVEVFICIFGVVYFGHGRKKWFVCKYIPVQNLSAG